MYTYIKFNNYWTGEEEKGGGDTGTKLYFDLGKDILFLQKDSLKFLYAIYIFMEFKKILYAFLLNLC